MRAHTRASMIIPAGFLIGNAQICRPRICKIADMLNRRRCANSARTICLILLAVGRTGRYVHRRRRPRHQPHHHLRAGSPHWNRPSAPGCSPACRAVRELTDRGREVFTAAEAVEAAVQAHSAGHPTVIRVSSKAWSASRPRTASAHTSPRLPQPRSREATRRWRWKSSPPPGARGNSAPASISRSSSASPHVQRAQVIRLGDYVLGALRLCVPIWTNTRTR